MSCSSLCTHASANSTTQRNGESADGAFPEPEILTLNLDRFKGGRSSGAAVSAERNLRSGSYLFALTVAARRR